MSPIARALSPDDAADVSAYFASLDTPFPPLAAADPNLVQKGRVLDEAGDPAKRIPACSACHGIGGTGQPPTIPYLAGQYEHYIGFQLQMWRQGFRRNSPEAMGLIAGKLDDEAIKAIAAYYQQARQSSPAAPAKE
jgi:cytochrome c553